MTETYGELPGIDHVYIEIEGVLPGDSENPPASYHIEGSGRTIAEAVQAAMESEGSDAQPLPSEA